MHRTVFLLLALLATAAVAQRLPEPEQFIDKSVITFPASIDPYMLAEIQYDADLWTHGVTSIWTLGAAPDGLRLSVFVYPIGHATESDVVAQQMADIEHYIRDTAKQGTYTHLTVGERMPFVVVAPKPSVLEEHEDKGGEQRKGDKDGDADEPFDLVPQPEVRVVANDASDPIAAALAAARPLANNHGQRQSFRFTLDGVPMRSLGYVFYRQLFAFKVRVSTPEDSMDDATFEALADTVTRTLVPHIHVENYGQCGRIILPAPSSSAGDEDQADATARQLLLEIARVRTSNCAETEGSMPTHEPRRERRVEILYPPRTWRQNAAHE